MDDHTITHQFTTAEAIAFVRKVDRTNSGFFYLHVRIDAPLPDQPGYVVPDALAHWIRLSRAQALALCASMLHDKLEERGGRIPITERKGPHDKRASYWIG